MTTRVALLVSWLVWWGTAHAGRTYVVDGTSADANRLHAQVRQHERALCDGTIPAADVDIDGTMHTVLAAGVLVFAKKGGRSFWGHAALRFLSCVEGRLIDTQFEYFRVGSQTLRLFPDLFDDVQPPPDPAYLARQRGRLVMRRAVPAADRGFIGQQLARNREIYALYLDLDPTALGALYAKNMRRYREQAERLTSGVDLPQTYQVLGRNCTHHLRLDLPAALPEPVASRVGRRVLPLAMLRDMDDVPVALAVVHLGPHGLRRLAARTGGVTGLQARWRETGGHLEVQRFRPVIRQRVVPEALDGFHRNEMGAGAVPAIVAYLLARRVVQR